MYRLLQEFALHDLFFAEAIFGRHLNRAQLMECLEKCYLLRKGTLKKLEQSADAYDIRNVGDYYRYLRVQEFLANMAGTADAGIAGSTAAAGIAGNTAATAAAGDKGIAGGKDVMDSADIIAIKGSMLELASQYNVLSDSNDTVSVILSRITKPDAARYVQVMRICGMMKCDGVFFKENMESGMKDLAKAAGWNDVQSLVALMRYDEDTYRRGECADRLYTLAQGGAYDGLLDIVMKAYCLKGQCEEVEECNILNRYIQMEQDSGSRNVSDVYNPLCAEILGANTLNAVDKEKLIISNHRNFACVRNLPLDLPEVRDVSFMDRGIACIAEEACSGMPDGSLSIAGGIDAFGNNVVKIVTDPSVMEKYNRNPGSGILDLEESAAGADNDAATAGAGAGSTGTGRAGDSRDMQAKRIKEAERLINALIRTSSSDVSEEDAHTVCIVSDSEYIRKRYIKLITDVFTAEEPRTATVSTIRVSELKPETMGISSRDVFVRTCRNGVPNVYLLDLSGGPDTGQIREAAKFTDCGNRRNYYIHDLAVTVNLANILPVCIADTGSAGVLREMCECEEIVIAPYTREEKRNAIEGILAELKEKYGLKSLEAEGAAMENLLDMDTGEAEKLTDKIVRGKAFRGKSIVITEDMVKSGRPGGRLSGPGFGTN